MDLDFEKVNGLVPAIIQDNNTLQILMLGYMNEAALKKTMDEKRVTFYSRSKKRLWTKGETSGNFLEVVDVKADCDKDCILVKVAPLGPVCHTGTTSCFQEETVKGFIYELQKIISERIAGNDVSSYTNSLYTKGINKMAQKVGEEAVELVIEAKDNNEIRFKDEAADLLYHFLILILAKGLGLEDIERVLQHRNKTSSWKLSV